PPGRARRLGLGPAGVRRAAAWGAPGLTETGGGCGGPGAAARAVGRDYALAMTDLAEHISRTALEALDAIPVEERPGTYVVSFFVYDEDDDPRRPTVTVGFNTEADVAYETSTYSTDEDEARWNYACWRQNRLAIV